MYIYSYIRVLVKPFCLMYRLFKIGFYISLPISLAFSVDLSGPKGRLSVLGFLFACTGFLLPRAWLPFRTNAFRWKHREVLPASLAALCVKRLEQEAYVPASVSAESTFPWCMCVCWMLSSPSFFLRNQKTVSLRGKKMNSRTELNHI